MYPFSHTDKNHADVASTCLEASEHVRRNAAAKVLNRHRHDVVTDIHLNVDFRTTGVAMNVGEALLQYAKKGNFHRPRHSSQLLRRLRPDLCPTALREALHVPLGGGSKSRLIQEARMQQVGCSPDFLKGAVSDFLK